MKTAIIYDKWLSGMGGGEVVACNMATCLRDNGYKVTIFSQKKVSAGEIHSKLGINIKDILLSTDPPPMPYTLNPPDLFINISFMDYSYGIGKRNIYYVHFPSKIRSGLFNYVLQLFLFLKNNFPIPYSLIPKPIQERINDRLRAGIYPDMKKGLNSYDTFITHSEYVKKWVKKLWNKDAQVLYPPVKLVNSLTREPVNPLTDLQLHLIGGVGNEPSSIRFVEKLQEMAKGYPVFFHFNVNREKVEEILLKSKIYWHAAGYGEDPERNPIKFEHFGIAPIEAISAGCIPILFNGGGLTEVVELLGYDKELHLFSTIDSLVDKTKNILMNHEKMIIDSKILNTNFFPFSFKEKFLQIIND